ncbi:MAG: threonine synthase [Bacillota bacterium]|nr:threonine synthase [Bacillota bacterium]MDK2784872.1 threonine synthase [Bacillota bacterium]MDK2881786.1 threonine synthase [Bacillota bacterium]
MPLSGQVPARIFRVVATPYAPKTGAGFVPKMGKQNRKGRTVSYKGGMALFVCPTCSARYPAEEPHWRCTCGSYLNWERPVRFDRDSIVRNDYSIWRYRHVLALAPGKEPVSLGEGWTPIVSVDWHGREILFKLDYLCPSGSFKDRGTAVLVSKLKAWGIEEVVEDSSGNAGASLAMYTARSGINCTIYAPASASRGKLVQIALAGARLVLVPGSREDTVQAVLKAAESTFYASHNLSPLFLEGIKTLALELAEQLGWEAPESIIIPVGNGSLALGLAAGFKLLQDAGLVSRLPRLIAVQSAACAPLAAAFNAGRDEPSPITKGLTMAEGIASKAPPRGREVLAAVRTSGGAFVTVTEEEITAAIVELAEKGLYVEPTSATAAAAFTKLTAEGYIRPGGQVVAVLTGSGLKATDKLAELFAAKLPL